MADSVTRRCMVSGKVQGVFFRASTRNEAQSLGVDGWARNLPDGRVEVVAHGERSAVDSLCRWLETGPPSARVDDVSCEPAEAQVEAGFKIV